MELKPSIHAVLRMVEQGISEEMVHWTLNNPQWMPAIGPNACYDAMIDGRRLRVVLAEAHAVPVLVTAHWVREGE